MEILELYRQCIAQMNLPLFKLETLNLCTEIMINIFNFNTQAERSNWDAVIVGGFYLSGAVINIENHSLP